MVESALLLFSPVGICKAREWALSRAPWFSRFSRFVKIRGSFGSTTWKLFFSSSSFFHRYQAADQTMNWNSRVGEHLALSPAPSCTHDLLIKTDNNSSIASWISSTSSAARVTDHEWKQVIFFMKFFFTVPVEAFPSTCRHDPNSKRDAFTWMRMLPLGR